MRMIDADELKNQVRHMPRTVNPDLVQYNLVQAIIENMPTLTPPNEWVSVEERLPEEEHLVLAYSKMFGMAVAMLYSGSWYGYNGEEGDYCSPYFYITHWMPLPAPPGTSLSSG